MLPSKTMVDYIREEALSETSRFFPTIRVDGNSSNTSPFVTPISNRYSSSTDSASSDFNASYNLSFTPSRQTELFQQPRSISPRRIFEPIYESSPLLVSTTYNFDSLVPNSDSFININAREVSSFNRHFAPYDLQNIERSQIVHTPIQTRQDTPIVGRKISGCHSNAYINELLRSESESIWKKNTQQSPDVKSFYERTSTLNPDAESYYGRTNTFQKPDVQSYYERSNTRLNPDAEIYYERTNTQRSPDESYYKRTTQCSPDESYYKRTNTQRSLDESYYKRTNAQRSPDESYYKRTNAQRSPDESYYKRTNAQCSPDESYYKRTNSQRSPGESYYELTNTQRSPDVPSYYELFPSKEKSEFRSTSKMTDITNYMNRSVSPTSSVFSSFLTENVSPDRSPNRTENFTLPYKLTSKPASSHDEIAPMKMCMFCRKNGETPVVYTDHNVKERIDNKYIVTCPILRSHVCVVCKATGDDAHTITYCPVLRNSNNGQRLQSTTVTLKNTPIKSNGKRRY